MRSMDEIRAAESLRNRLNDLTKQRDALWALLDNIDTLDDSCRDNDCAFRDLARREQKKRFDIYNPKETDEEWHERLTKEAP